jgi:hypothetical protein
MYSYQIFVKPVNGPCTVEERDFQNGFNWNTKSTDNEKRIAAIEIAKKKKIMYPNMDFIVHSVSESNK